MDAQLGRIRAYAENLAGKEDPREWESIYEVVKYALLTSIHNAKSWSSSDPGSTHRKLLELKRAIVSAYCDDSEKYGPMITVLNISNFSDAPSWPFEYLPNLEELNISGCTSINNEDFKYLSKLKKLEMRHCHQITDTAFTHLKNLTYLDMQYCSQSTITNAAFTNMKNLEYLNLMYGPTSITPEVLVPLYYVKDILWKNGTSISTPLEIAIQLRDIDVTAGIIANQIGTETLTSDPEILEFLRSSFDPVRLEEAISSARKSLAKGPRELAMHAFLKAHGPGGSIEKARRERIAAPHGRNIMGYPIQRTLGKNGKPLLNLWGEDPPSSSGGSRPRPRPRPRSRRYKKSRLTRRNKSSRRIKRTKSNKKTKAHEKW
jgi:hypothetical protein